MLEVKLRPAADEDEAFLLALYRSTRADELAMFGWDDLSLQAFVQMQYRARKQAFALSYPAAEYSIIESDGKSAGSMIVETSEAAIHLVDIAILPQFRGRGIGRAVIEMLQQSAVEAGVPLTLHVATDNIRAKQLYESMGFRVVDEGQLQFRMEWRMLTSDPDSDG